MSFPDPLPPHNSLSQGLTRRQWLIGATGLATPFLLPQAQAQTPTYFQQLLGEYLGDGQKFKASNILDLARQLAKKPYTGPTNAHEVNVLNSVFHSACLF